MLFRGIVVGDKDNSKVVSSFMVSVYYFSELVDQLYYALGFCVSNSCLPSNEMEPRHNLLMNIKGLHVICQPFA